MTGTQLKHSLNLEKLFYVYIQKVMGIPMNVFVLTFDSRFPNVYLPLARVKKSNATTIQKVSSANSTFANMTNYSFTPPVIIEYTEPLVNTGTLIIKRDIGAEYLLNKKLYENINLKEIEMINI
jgi:hypothetical protein